MIAHLIGNGPSKDKFPVGIIPTADVHVYGCNFGTDQFTHTALFIHDNRVCEHIIKHKKVMPCPIILRGRQHELYSAKLKPFCQIADVVNLKLFGKTLSAGHMALKYLIEKRYSEIHLWGLDSLLSGTVQSDSKGKIDGSNPNQKKIVEWEILYREHFKYASKKGVKVYLHSTAESFKEVTLQ